MSSVTSNLSDVPAELLPKFSSSPLRVVLHATNHPSKDGESTLITDLGIDPAFIADPSPRTLEVCVFTGRPKTDLDAPGATIKVMLEHPMISYNMMVGDNGNFRMLAIGCTERTHFAIVRSYASFAFYVPRSSMTMQDAILELLYNNLIKGPKIYDKSASIIHNFFEKALQAIFPDPVILTTVITSVEGHEMPCRIYFDPEDPKEAMISIDGYVYGFNVNEYPKPQINRTLRIIERNENLDRRKRHRNPAHMNHREKAEMAKRLEQSLAGSTVSTDALAGGVVQEGSVINIVDGVV